MGDVVPMRSGDGAQVPPLWRELAGEVLRDRRHARGERLHDTAARAGISTQYLSEVERGRKDPSSEVLSAVAGALDLTLLDLTVGVARRLHVASTPAGARGRDAGTLRGPLALAA